VQRVKLTKNAESSVVEKFNEEVNSRAKVMRAAKVAKEA